MSDDFSMEMAQKIGQSVFPLLGFDGRDKVCIVGSAVFVRHKGEYFLLTAAHVLDLWGAKPILLGLPTGIVEVTIPAIKSKSVRSDHKDDVLDIAYFPIFGQFYDNFIGYDSITLEDYTGIPVSYPRENMFAFGYPSSKLFVDFKKKEYDAPPLQYQGTEMREDEIFLNNNADQATHILISFSKRKSKSIKKNGIVMAPDPYGCSGGALFRIYGDAEGYAKLLIFEGILTNVIKGSKPGMLALRRTIIRDFISLSS